MRAIKFRFSFKVGSNVEFQYRTLDELLDCSFAHEEMVTLINEECDIYEIEDLIEFELISKDEYTGLKDKNGVEIFEGDVVKYLFPKTIHCQEHEETIGVVEYIDCSTSFRVCNDWHGDLPIHEDVQIFVIGNVHENPELLESDNE